jgi:DNA-binding response OmpR family regulator
LQIGDIEINFEGFSFARAGKSETVASKDLLLLKLLVEQSPRAVSRDQALNTLWGEDKFPSNRTVDNAVLRLRTSLGDRVSPCIESVRGIGYRWNAENLEKEK